MLFGQSHILALENEFFLQLGNSGVPGEKGDYKGFGLHRYRHRESPLWDILLTVQGMWTPSQLLFLTLHTPLN